ncbi:MAG: DUF523 domain-containing protein [Aristaeellaceae bacterium]
MAIVVSACLMGRKCKYSGGDNLCPAVRDYVAGQEVIPVCPETRCGMPAPRPPVEMREGRLIDCHGRDVDALYREGVALTMADIAGKDVTLAILQPRSPTCGVHAVYDGSFTGRLIPGRGVLAQALVDKGIPIMDAEDLIRAAKAE